MQNRIDEKYKFLLDEVKSENKIRLESFKMFNEKIDKEVPSFINDLRKYRDECSDGNENLKILYKEEFYKYFTIC